MIYKIVAYFFLPCMVIALLLSFVGVQQVQFDNSYMNFLRGVSMRLDSWAFNIPNIPEIPLTSNASGLIEAIVTILNGFVSVLNVLVMIVNVLIRLIQFILTIIYCVINFRDTMALSSVNFFSSIIG